MLGGLQLLYYSVATAQCTMLWIKVCGLMSLHVWKLVAVYLLNVFCVPHFQNRWQSLFLDGTLAFYRCCLLFVSMSVLAVKISFRAETSFFVCGFLYARGEWFLNECPAILIEPPRRIFFTSKFYIWHGLRWLYILRIYIFHSVMFVVKNPVRNK